MAEVNIYYYWLTLFGIPSRPTRPRMQLVVVAKSLGGEGGTMHPLQNFCAQAAKVCMIPAVRDMLGFEKLSSQRSGIFQIFFACRAPPISCSLALALSVLSALVPSLLFRSGLSLVCSLARVPSRFTCAVRPPLQPWQSDCADPPPWPTSSPNDPHPRHCLRGLGASSETLCGKLCECQCLENPA